MIDRHLLLVVVGERQPFVERLGTGVGPPRPGGGPEAEVVVLVEGKLRALAVDLGRRGDQHELPLAGRRIEHDLGRADVGLDGVDRLLHDQAHADRRRQMDRRVAAVDELDDQRLVERRTDAVGEPWRPDQVLDVRHAAGRQIVEDEHAVAAGEQPFREMRPDEPGAAGDEHLHDGVVIRTMCR